MLTATRLVAAVVALVLACACTAETAPRPRGAPPATTPSEARAATGGVARRDAAARLPKVWNEAIGPSAKRVRRAIRTLKRVRMWKKLMWKNLYVIQIQSRSGLQRVPEDHHLADASYHGYMDEEGSGSLCYILFYGRSIKNELANWSSLAAQGLARYEPPTLEQLWAAVLAHELGHCHKGFRREKIARKWEARAWKALGRPDLAELAVER